MPSKPLRIFFSAGEPSGDLHGANLIRQLRACCGQFEAVGYGGPRMQQAGCRLHHDMTALAVMWLGRALLHVLTFARLFMLADRYFRRSRPDALVLIDYPGFNWWLARRAKAHGIPVIYYLPPQLWAWAPWRVHKMRRLADHVLCGLPFEEAWFREHGCNAMFVGHPFFDEVRQHPYDEAFVAERQSQPGPLVTILPGSRTQEVEANFPWLRKAAEQVVAQVPDVRFAVAAFQPEQAEWVRRQLADSGLPVEVYVERTPELIRAAACCMAVSGSVCLELLYHTKPSTILYHISPLAYFVQGLFRKVKYITLVNLLTTDELHPADLSPFHPSQPDAAKVLFPEYLTCEDKSGQIAAHVVEWLSDAARRDAVVGELERLKAEISHGGASAHAADYILAALSPAQPAAPALKPPHFRPNVVRK